MKYTFGDYVCECVHAVLLPSSTSYIYFRSVFLILVSEEKSSQERFGERIPHRLQIHGKYVENFISTMYSLLCIPLYCIIQRLPSADTLESWRFI